MIIQCQKCETRFRFDDTLIDGDGVWVRCSRCQHVFFQPRATRDIPAVEPDIPSVRIRDARRIPDDRLPAAEDRLKWTETQAEPQPAAPLRSVSGPGEVPTVSIRSDREGETDFGREPSIEGLGMDFRRGTLAGPDAADEKEDVEMVRETLARLVAADQTESLEMSDAAEEDDFPVDEAARGGWGRILVKVVVLLVFGGIVAGSVYLYLFPDIRTQVMGWAAPRLQGVPLLENLLPAQMKHGGTVMTPVLIRDLRQRSVTNLLGGNLSVIEGIAVNQSSSPLARIKVRLVIADAYDVVLKEKIVYCGNLLTDAELGALAESEIQRELSLPQGSDVSNELILPNSGIPFMIVFNQEQAGAIKTTVTPAGADRLP